MNAIEPIEAAEERRGRGRPRGTGPRSNTTAASRKARDVIEAAGNAGFGSVRMTIDKDGAMSVTLARDGAPTVPDDVENGEQNEWDTRLDQLEKTNRDE